MDIRIAIEDLTIKEKIRKEIEKYDLSVLMNTEIMYMRKNLRKENINFFNITENQRIKTERQCIAKTSDTMYIFKYNITSNKFTLVEVKRYANSNKKSYSWRS